MSKIISHAVKQTDTYADIGDAYEIQCPQCGETVFWAEYMMTNRNVCYCGYKWRVQVRAVGAKGVDVSHDDD